MCKSHPKVDFINIIASPWILAIPILVVVLFFLPNPNQKYKLTLDQQQMAHKKNSATQFFDLNNDGNDELVTYFHNVAKSKAAFKVVIADGITLEQWNMNGYYSYIMSSYTCKDLNKDGFGEIYTLFYRHDSVFLSGIQPYPNREWLFKEKFVTKVWERNHSIDYTSGFSESYDFDGDGIDELVFVIRAGFSRQPRSIYIFNTQKNEISSSASVGAMIGTPLMADLNHDQIPELYVGSSTPLNIPDTMPILLHDYSSWLMGYDQDLKWLFPPIENKACPSGVTPLICIAKQDTNRYILWHINHLQKEEANLKIYNHQGELIKSFPYINNLDPNYKPLILNKNDMKWYYCSRLLTSDFQLHFTSKENISRSPKNPVKRSPI